jgi:hypothetical protein
MSANFDEIYAALKMRPWMEASVVRERADALHALLSALRWDRFKIEPPEGIPIPGRAERYPIVHNTFGDVRRSIENARNPFAAKRALSEMEGTGIDREDIHYFAKICLIGEGLIPHLWPADPILQRALRATDTHLDTLNEVWWLARMGRD